MTEKKLLLLQPLQVLKKQTSKNLLPWLKKQRFGHDNCGSHRK